jgi:hypothetical protein
MSRGNFKFTKHFQASDHGTTIHGLIDIQACVKRRAILSVSQNPPCSGPGVAQRAVNEVFDSCFKDTQPFDEIY